MLIDKSPIQIISYSDFEARIYSLQLGYRVELSNTLGKLYWHPGLFKNKQELCDWLRSQLEALVEDSVSLSGEWLEGELYRDWFISKTSDGDAWQGYDPMTNRRHCALTLAAIKEKIDWIEADFNCS